MIIPSNNCALAVMMPEGFKTLVQSHKLTVKARITENRHHQSLT